MADKVPLGSAIVWFEGTESEQDQQALEMALPDVEVRQIAAGAWRSIDDRYRWLLDARPVVEIEGEENFNG